MRRSGLAFAAVVLILSGGGWAPLQAQASSEEGVSEIAIRKIVKDWTGAFNRHDAKAVAALFAENATFVNVYGELSQGRSEIEASRTALHRDHFQPIADGNMTTNVTAIRFMRSDVAMAHVGWTLDSATLGSLSTLSTLILSRQHEKWTIIGFHTTPIRPPEWRDQQDQGSSD